MFFVGKDLRLQGKKRAPGVHQINAGQVILLGNGLSAQMLFNCQGVVAAAFDGGIVSHHHTFTAVNKTNTGHYTGTGYVFAIHVMGGQLAYFKKR